MVELLEGIGHNIRRLREEKGWNQTELGFHADTSPSIISLIENAKRNPSTATLAKIAGALGVEVVELFPKASSRSSLELSLFYGREDEWRAKLEEAERAVQYITGRAEWYEEELERGGAHEYKEAADRAHVLAVTAIEEFSSFNRWFSDAVARDLVREIENGDAPELVDEFDALEETLIERISRTQRTLLDNANGLAETAAGRLDLARRRTTADSNIRSRRRSA